MLYVLSLSLSLTCTSSVGYKDMEWQTPAVSEKFQRRFGWRPSTADSGDTGFGATPSDYSEGETFPALPPYTYLLAVIHVIVAQ